MKIINPTLLSTSLLIISSSALSAATLTNFDVIGSIKGGTSSPISGEDYGTDESGNKDSVQNSTSSTNGARNDDNGVVYTRLLDLVDFNAGAPQMGADGIFDTQIIVTTSGLSGPHDYRSTFFTTSGAIGSRLGNHKDSLATTPVPTSGTVGSPGSTYSGLDIITQTIEIRFINQIQATVANLGAFSVSSGNTRTGNTNAFENSTVQLLGAGFNPFTAVNTNNTEIYEEDRASLGYAGAGLFHANGDTQDNVGTANAMGQDNGATGYPFHDDNYSVAGADADNAGIASSALTGISFTQTLIDTRGDSDTNFDYTFSITSGSLTDIEIIPEPSTHMLLLLGALGFITRRRK